MRAHWLGEIFYNTFKVLVLKLSILDIKVQKLDLSLDQLLWNRIKDPGLQSTSFTPTSEQAYSSKRLFPLPMVLS